MINIKSELLRFKNEQEKILKDCEDHLFLAPEGRIDVNHWNNGEYYIHCVEKNKSKIRKGITHHHDTIEQLINKEYYSNMLELVRNNISEIDDFLTKFEPNVQKHAFDLLNSWKQSLFKGSLNLKLESINSWKTQNYRVSTYKQEQKNIQTISGEFVRSKSEREIANSLARAGIPFRYEAALDIEDGTIFPDFTILSPRNGQIYYWEHAGMLDNPSYIKNNYNRLSQYASIGIFPGDKLILSGETQNHPLDTMIINQIISNYFE